MTDSSDSKPLLINEDAKPEAKGWRAKYCEGKNAKILAYSIGLLCAAVGNSVFFKKMTNHWQNYPYFISQLTTVAYVPIFFGVVWYEIKFTNLITPAMREFPKKKFIWMGFFDSCAGILMVFGGVRTSGSTQALLLNAIIPMTMILSYIFLKARYKPLQYVGASTIIIGVVVVIIPSVIDKSSNDGSDDPFFNMLFLLSCLPQAGSGVYKELAFNDADIDVNYLQAWVALAQLMFGFAFIPLTTFKFLGSNAMPWDQILSALGNGAKCLAGINSVVPESSGCSFDVSATNPCDICSGAWQPVVLYLVFNCCYNVFIVLVIKHGSAALMYIVMTLRLPLIQIAFAIPFIQNPPDAFEWEGILGLFLILAGLVAYRWTSSKEAAEKQAAEEAAKAAKAAADADAPAVISSGTTSESVDLDTDGNDDKPFIVSERA